MREREREIERERGREIERQREREGKKSQQRERELGIFFMMIFDFPISSFPTFLETKS